MTVTTTPHLNFRGRAREALAFYASVFGAVEEPAQADDVAFGRVDAPSGFSIMAYDVQPSKAFDPGENPFYVTLQGSGADEVRPLWDALADGAETIPVPLAPAAFSPLYGMLTDRFGVTWIVGADAADEPG